MPTKEEDAPGRQNLAAWDVPQPVTPRAKPGTYELRVLVHNVNGASTFGEFFPDVYVKARMYAPRGAWQRTDVHHKSVDGEALFEYRLVLPPFMVPPPPQPRRAGPRRAARPPPPPTLEVVAMDADRLTRDDRLGGALLPLTALAVPEDAAEQCGLATLANPRVNLFRADSLDLVRGRHATFPRELTGHWPLLRKKRLSREPLAACSVELTLQLLSTAEAAARPAASGNAPGSDNRFPTLTRPARRRGRLRDRLFLGRLALLESLLLHATGMASTRRLLCTAALVTLLFSVSPDDVAPFLALLLDTLLRLLSRHPTEVKAGAIAATVVIGGWAAWAIWGSAAARSTSPDTAAGRQGGTSRAVFGSRRRRSPSRARRAHDEAGASSPDEER